MTLGCYYMLSTEDVNRSLAVAVIMAYEGTASIISGIQGEIVMLCYHHAKQLEQSYALASIFSEIVGYNTLCLFSAFANQVWFPTHHVMDYVALENAVVND
jgi:hypothetical protein